MNRLLYIWANVSHDDIQSKGEQGNAWSMTLSVEVYKSSLTATNMLLGEERQC